MANIYQTWLTVFSRHLFNELNMSLQYVRDEPDLTESQFRQALTDIIVQAQDRLRPDTPAILQTFLRSRKRVRSEQVTKLSELSDRMLSAAFVEFMLNQYLLQRVEEISASHCVE